eukprot:4477453-Alexandrium_andersonii.AAC.1
MCIRDRISRRNCPPMGDARVGPPSSCRRPGASTSNSLRRTATLQPPGWSMEKVALCALPRSMPRLALAQPRSAFSVVCLT